MLKQMLEKEVGHGIDNVDFFIIAECADMDIKFNGIFYGKKTNAAELLRRMKIIHNMYRVILSQEKEKADLKIS